MTPDRCKELLPIMQAFAEGKEVQARPLAYHKSNWYRVATPTWAEDSECRIKPQPIKTVGYRRYIYGSTYLVGSVLEGVSWSELERHNGFVRWIDTEWQYETIDV